MILVNTAFEISSICSWCKNSCLHSPAHTYQECSILVCAQPLQLQGKRQLWYYSLAAGYVSQKESKKLFLLLNCSWIKLFIFCWQNPFWLPRHSRSSPSCYRQKSRRKSNTLPLYRIKNCYLLIIKDMEKCTHAALYV